MDGVRIMKRNYTLGVISAVAWVLLLVASPAARAEEDMLSDAQVDALVQENMAALTNSPDQEISPAVASQYTLGPNDVLEITVLRHSEVSGSFTVNQEGVIQYQFVGDINVEGKTKDEVSTILKEKLSEYIISPDVTVKISGYNSKIVYVVGEVGHPGKIYMRGDTITVREALIQAGLPLLSAKATKSYLITPDDDGKMEKQKVNVHKLLYQGDLRENYVMKPGDMLYVPPTVLAKTMRILQPVAAPISTAATTGRTVTTGF